MAPGDTLILLDGIYNESLTPPISGAVDAPITFSAKNRGGAVIQMTADGPAICVSSNTRSTRHHLVFDGLIARSKGEHAAILIKSDDNVTEAQMTNNITIKNTGAFGSANLVNEVVFSVGNNARDCLLEDIWAYGFGRKALQIFGSIRITVRRAVLRYDYWDGSSYKPNDPRVSFSGYNTVDSVFENIIAIDSAPTPPGRSADRAAFVASGNQTPALVTGSARNKYLGLIALNNFGNGLEINGGSGDGTEDNEFRDVIVWGSDVDRSSYGINVQSNDLRSSFSNVTVGHCGLTGFKINPYSQEPIADEQIVNSFSTGNGGYGFYYESSNVALFTGNSATDNSSGNDIEPAFAPSITHLPRPQQVPGHERGATVYYRYVDGILTNIPLWPWPNEELIKQCMCNPADLAAVGRVAANGNGWEPQWSRTDKTLTRYIWEYLGHPTPDDIYGPPIDSTPPTAPTNLTGAVSSSTKIDLSWAASTDLSTGSGQASGVAGYRIYRNSVEVGISSTNSYNDTGLSAATPYTYCVSAYDVAGNQSGQSDSFTVTTLAVNRAPELAPIGSRSVPRRGAATDCLAGERCRRGCSSIQRDGRVNSARTSHANGLMLGHDGDLPSGPVVQLESGRILRCALLSKPGL